MISKWPLRALSPLRERPTNHLRNSVQEKITEIPHRGDACAHDSGNMGAAAQCRAVSCQIIHGFPDIFLPEEARDI